MAFITFYYVLRRELVDLVERLTTHWAALEWLDTQTSH